LYIIVKLSFVTLDNSSAPHHMKKPPLLPLIALMGAQVRQFQGPAAG